jgi:glycosyltransferase involved in cell wall biosynthesis
LWQGGDRVTIVSGDALYFTGGRVSKSRLLWRRENVDNIEVVWVRIPFGGSRKILLRMLGFLWFIPVSFLAALPAPSPDVIIATSTPLTIGIPALLLSWFRRVPFIFELRDLWPDCVVDYNVVRNRALIRAAYWLESFLYRRATAIVALTRGIRERVISKGIAPDKVWVITNAADLEPFSPVGPRMDLESLTGVPPSSFVYAYVGSLVWTNALSWVMEGMDYLRDRKDIHLILLGSGPEKGWLMQEVAKRGLRNVHFLDPVPKSEVPAFLRNAQAGILTVEPCRLAHIFLPNKFFDYLACGCPVVLNFDGEAREYVEGAGAGVYVPPGDARALAEALQALADSPERLRQMSANARHLAEKQFGWDHKVSEYREMLSSVVKADQA